MAQKIHIVLEDDISGGEATETVTFGLDGATYEIDLNDTNASALREALAPYVGNGRKVTATGGRGRGRRTSGGSAASSNGSANGSGPSAKEIREWARANGYDVPDRGRVSAEVREAYDAAH